MADDAGEKNFAPSEKKLADARKKGQTATAAEARHAAMLGGAALAVGVAGWCTQALAAMAAGLWGGAGQMRLHSAGDGRLLAGQALGGSLWAILPLLIVLMLAAVVGALAQGRPSWSTARLALKWEKLSPAAGLKRLFGPCALGEFAKVLIKLALVLAAALLAVWSQLVVLGGMVGAPVPAIGALAAELSWRMLAVVAVLAAALALGDGLWQHRAFRKRMMMTREEVKQEAKEAEGNPEIKGRMRQIARQRARQRMMAAVPRATVIVTNPTHYAVALQYDHAAMAAPVVVAKGVDAVALRIREIGREAGVPVIESPPLARALFAQSEIEQPIPVEHYAAVAEIISYVMRLAATQR